MSDPSRLIKRLHSLMGENPWGWKERDTLCEIIEALIEEIYRNKLKGEVK